MWGWYRCRKRGHSSWRLIKHSGFEDDPTFRILYVYLNMCILLVVHNDRFQGAGSMYKTTVCHGNKSMEVMCGKY